VLFVSLPFSLYSFAVRRLRLYCTLIAARISASMVTTDPGMMCSHQGRGLGGSGLPSLPGAGTPEF